MKRLPKQLYLYPTEMMLALYLTVLGYMIPVIRETFDLSLTAAGLFSTLQSIGLFVALILCFCVFSGLNKARVITVSMVLLSLCMVLLGLNRVVFVLYVLFFFIGFFNGVSDTLQNALIMDLSAHKPKFYTGLLHALWATAGVAGPYFALALRGDYTNAFVALGIVTAAATMLLIFGFRGSIRKPLLQSRAHMGTIKKLVQILKVRGMKLFVSMAFFNCFTQISFVYFISAYVSGQKGGIDGALSLALLFAGFLIARVLYSLFGHRFCAFKVMAVMNTITVCAFVVMLLVQNDVLTGAMILIGGMGISIAVPGLVVEACEVVPHDTAAASALVFFGIGLGAFVGPLITGAIGDAAGLQIGLLAATGVLLPFIALSWLAARRFAHEAAK